MSGDPEFVQRLDCGGRVEIWTFPNTSPAGGWIQRVDLYAPGGWVLSSAVLSADYAPGGQFNTATEQPVLQDRESVPHRVVQPGMDVAQNAVVADRAHDYRSTACVHARHGECRLTCKFCPASCLCWCHQAAGEPDGSTDGGGPE